MGLANAQRTLYYIRVITEFISQPEYQDVIPIFGIVNEAVVGSIGINELTSFYLEAHTMIRTNITGLGAGHGPVRFNSIFFFLLVLGTEVFVGLVHRDPRWLPTRSDVDWVLTGFGSDYDGHSPVFLFLGCGEPAAVGCEWA